MPSNSQASSLFPMAFISAFKSGHIKVCYSSFLCHKQNPFWSQYSILTILRFLLQKTKRWPEKGLSSKCSLTRMDNPLIDFLISVKPMARYTVILADGINITRLQVLAIPVSEYFEKIRRVYQFENLNQS